MVEVSNNFIQECEANVGTYKFGKIKVNYIDDNPLNYEQGAYSSSNGAKIDAEQSVRYNKLVECESNFKYKIELGNSAIKMKIITYTEAQAFIAAHDNLIDGNELTTEATAKYLSVTIYSNDTLEGTSITLNNTIRNGEILGAELKGNTIQNGTPTPTSPIEVKNVTGEQVVTICRKNLMKLNLITTATTYSGVTFTPNDDGTITLNGTATSTRWVDLSNIDYGSTAFNLGEVTNTIKSLTSNDYTMNAKITNEKVNVNYNANNKFTSCYIYKDTNYNNAILQIQLEKGTSATSYEEYQGKDYEINFGKNLYEGSQDFSGTWANSTSWSTAEETYNGLVVKYGQSAWNGLYKEIYVQRGDIYTFSFFAKKETEGQIRAYFTGPGVDGTPQNKRFNATTEWQRFSFTFTITTSGKLRARVENPTNDSITYICGYQLEKSGTMTSYSPYFEPIELNKIGNYQDFIRKGTGKNLFDEIWEQGSIDANTGENVSTSSSVRRSVNYIRVEPNTTYTISRTINGNSCPIREYGIDKSFIGSQTPLSASSYSASFTTPNNVYYIRLVDWVNNDTSKIMIEKGSQATYYEPYGYKDKWYIEKNVGKIVLNGTQNITLASSGTRRFSATYSTLGLTNIKDGTSNADTSNYRKCDHFVYGTSPSTFGNYYLYANWLVLLDTSTEIADANALKTWFSNNNTKIYYVLANTTYTLIENEELIEQLDAVSHAETQEGITNIMTTGDLPAILDVMPDLTESIRGKQIKPYIGYNITSHDDLKNFKITGKADSNGKILGATPQTQIDIEIFNENNKHNLENKQIYVSTGLDETEGNYVEWQPFTITQAKDTQTKNHTNYTGYDDMMRNTTQYIDNIDYGEEGIPLYDYLCKVAKQIGMVVANDSIVNGDFIVRGNNFTNNEKISTVLSDIGKIADGFMMINRDNLLEVVDIAPIDDTREAIELTTNLYNEDFQNSPAFGPTNELAIGETNIETNAIVKSDEEAIAKDGVKKIEILDNYFLGELADKEEVANVLWEHLNGFSYYPYKTPYNGYPYIDLGDKLNITDINNNTYNSFIFNYVFEYNGGYKGNVGAEALSVTAAKYKTNNTLGKQFRKVGIEIDRVDGKITSEIDTRDQADKDLVKAYTTAIEQSTGSISSRVEAVEKTLNGDGTAENPGVIEDIKTINKTMLTQDSSAFSAVVEQQDVNTSDIKEYNDDKNLQAIRKQIKFDINGVTMTAEGSTDADMKLHLSNKQIEFLYGNSPVLTINGNSIKFSSVSFEELGLGNYRWQDEADDSLSLYYKEEETT